MRLDRWSISVKLSRLTNLLCLLLFYYITWNHFEVLFRQWEDTLRNKRIMAGSQPRTSCRNLFNKSEILPVPCQYILSLRKFSVNNEERFQTNLSIYIINTRNNHQLHRKNTNISFFQDSKFCVGIYLYIYIYYVGTYVCIYVRIS
jgi:hypothetical protein